MKKILQSIVLFITISSNLFATDYHRYIGGDWDDSTRWSSNGVPIDDWYGDVYLHNERPGSFDLSLNDQTYLIKELNVSGNDWTLSRGSLTLSRGWFAGDATIRYSGTQTLTLATNLKLESNRDTILNVSDPAGIIRLLGVVTGRSSLAKTGPGTLLIEAPYFAGDNQLSQLRLCGGTIGIAPAMLGHHGISVEVDSKLFALNGDLYITGNLNIPSGINLNIINPNIINPNDPTSHSVTFWGDKFGNGTINQLSDGDLIFEGRDDFEGTINTYGSGRIVLNGDTGADIEMNSGEIAGKGGTRGRLTAQGRSPIISPGYRGSAETLSFGNVYLGSGTVLNFTLGNTSSHIHVNGDLTLAGKLNIGAAPGFGTGIYSLLSYTGKLTYKEGDLELGSVPEGYDVSKFRFYVQRDVVPGQFNLLVPEPARDLGAPNGDRFSTFQFLDGGRITADGKILGGDGVWNNTDTTWSSVDGLSKNTWNGYRAIFAGAAGKVDVQDDVSFRNIDIIADGYTVHSTNDSKLLANGSTTINVGSTYQAGISAEIGGTGSVSKIGTGTLTLSHDNSYTGGTVLKGGTLVADTPNALSTGPVTLEEGVLRLGNTHTLEVGSYIQNKDAGLVLRVNSSTDYDQLVVNRSAKLGGTLFIAGKPSNFNVGKGILLVTSQDLNGSRFDDVQFTQTSIKKLSASYDDNNVYATARFDSIYPYGKSPNTRALAHRLDLFSNTGQNENLFNHLADIPLERLPVALETLVPNQVFVLSSIGLSVSRSQMHSLQGRLDDLNSGYTSYGQFNANASNQHRSSLAGVSTQTNFLMNKSQAQERWSFYMHGNGGFGRQRQDSENETVGYDYGQGGTFIGADYRLSDKVYIGGAASYTYTDASFQGDRGSLSADSYFGHLYTAYAPPKGLNLISSVGFGDHEFDLKRRALIDTARSQPQGREVDFQSQISYNIPLKSNFTILPYTALAYSAFWMKGFQEYSSEASLKISDDQTNSLRSTVGVKAKYEKRFTKGIRKASVEANLGWDHEYCDAQSRGINAEWVGSGVPSFPVRGGRIGPDTLISGVNLRFLVTKLLSVTTGYNIAANSDYVSHGFNVGVNLAF